MEVIPSQCHAQARQAARTTLANQKPGGIKGRTTRRGTELYLATMLWQSATHLFRGGLRCMTKARQRVAREDHHCSCPSPTSKLPSPAGDLSRYAVCRHTQRNSSSSSICVHRTSSDLATSLPRSHRYLRIASLSSTSRLRSRAAGGHLCCRTTP
jgi:hypothetical protein